MHQRQEVAPKAALIRMAHENLLRVFRVHGNLTASAMIADTTEQTIEANLFPVPMNVERHAALGRRFFERRFRLELIDVDVTGTWQEIGGKTKPMVPFLPDR